MEIVFKNKIEAAEEKLQSIEKENALNALELLNLLANEFNMILSTSTNFKEKLLSHLLLARLNRTLFNLAQLVEIKTFHFENAIFEITEALILSKLPELKTQRNEIINEGQAIWKGVDVLINECEKNIIYEHFKGDYFRSRISSTFDVPFIEANSEKKLMNFDKNSEVTNRIFKIMSIMKEEDFDLEKELGDIKKNSFYEFSFF